PPWSDVYLNDGPEAAISLPRFFIRLVTANNRAHGTFTRSARGPRLLRPRQPRGGRPAVRRARAHRRRPRLAGDDRRRRAHHRPGYGREGTHVLRPALGLGQPVRRGDVGALQLLRH